MEFRNHNWFDIEKRIELYGVQCRRNNGGPWCHLLLDGKPAIYQSENERDQTIKTLRAGLKMGSGAYIPA